MDILGTFTELKNGSMKIVKVLILGMVSLMAFDIQAQFSAGGGVVLATHSGYDFDERDQKFNAGIQLLAGYELTEKLGVGFNLNLFYPNKMVNEVIVDSTVTETTARAFTYNANIDIKYTFFENKHNAAYIMVGPSFGALSISSGDISESTSFIGGHIGIGVELTNNLFYDMRLQYRQWESGIEFSNYQGMVAIGYRFPFESTDEEVLEMEQSKL